MTIYLKRGDKGTAGDGGKGDWILSWQSFLAGQGIYVGDYSPNFGPKTKDATERAQAAWGIAVDGKVGDDTTDAAVARGLNPPWRPLPVDRTVPKSTTLAEHGLGYMDPKYPAPSDLDGDGRADLVYLSEDERQDLWGPLEYKLVEGKPVLTHKLSTPQLNDWYTENVVTIKVPQLVGVDVYGTPSSGRCQFHKLAAAQLLGAFQEADDAGFADLLLTYGGTYNMRFIRGSTTTLSNHAFAVAIDLNMAWNGLGKQPALVGEKGSLRRLVTIFEKWGFYWGGWYRSRKDGQHFECVKWIDTATCRKMVNALSANDHILPWLKDVA